MKLLVTALLTTGLVLGGTACSSGDATSATPSAHPSATVQTSFPGLPAPTGDPELDGIADARPATGTVAWVKGAFDDRFDVKGLRIAHGRVTGTITVTSDVSTLLELQVLVHFFDADGTDLGERRWTLHDDEEEPEGTHPGPPVESRAFAVQAPTAYAARAVSAAAGVTVLVNE